MSLVSKIGIAFKESYEELVKRVTWPTRQELSSSAVVVMIASLIIAAFILLVDTSFDTTINWVYGLLGAR